MKKKTAQFIEAKSVPEKIEEEEVEEFSSPLPAKKKIFTKKNLWILLGAVMIIAIIVISSVVNSKKTAAAQAYQTEAVQRGELVALVGATGTVRANQTAILAWQTTGRIETIHFAEGEKVAAGEEMASLAESSLPQSIILAQSDLFNAQQALNNLKNSNAATSAAELTLAQAQREYNNALGNYWNRNETQGTEDLITVTRARLQLADNKVYDLQKLYDRMGETPDNDTVKAQTLANLTQAKIDRDKIKELLDYYEANPDSLDVEILQAKLDVAKANLDDAKREYDRLKDGTDPEEIAAAEARIAALDATVSLGILEAPFSGTVTEVNSMVGDLVTAGTSTFRVDDLSHLIVDIQVPEVDINAIKVGQTAVFTFDAIPDKEYAGKVTKVALVGDAVGGVVNFKVSLQILNPDAQVLPGMTAAVNITVNQKEDVLLAPNRAIRLVNDQYVIYLLKNGQAVMVPIEIGATSDTNSEIVSGDVNEGDLVILNPTSSLIDMMQSQSMSGGTYYSR